MNLLLCDFLYFIPTCQALWEHGVMSKSKEMTIVLTCNMDICFSSKLPCKIAAIMLQVTCFIYDAHNVLPDVNPYQSESVSIVIKLSMFLPTATQHTCTKIHQSIQSIKFFVL